MKLKLFVRFLSKRVKYPNMSFPESPARASLCCESTPDGAPSTYAMYEALKELCHDNATFFNSDESENGQRIYHGFMTLMDNVDTVWPLVDHVRKVAPQYDFDAKSPGNGYRSFVSVVDSCVLHGLKLGRQVHNSRDALLFRKSHFVREVESCSQLLASLGTCLHHIHTLLGWAQPGDLFPAEHHSPEELFSQADTINQYCFYGRCLGFQFLPSMRGILKGISICMAGFSEAYYSQGNLISSVWTGGQYVIDPELRARRIVNISQCASVEFCKAFWFLAESEIMQRVPSLVSSNVAVNKLISIPPEPITFTKVDGTNMTLQPPTVHIGPQQLNVRLICVNKRIGMVGEGSGGQPPADGILFHCHGGGFVAQSSKSHEAYLREWAAKLNVPILSVDYSLAPHAPFPRAVEEVFYAYCWMLKNFNILGTTGKRIIFAGDSAGANLVASCTVKIVEQNIRRPDGMFLAYVPVLVQFVPSPARLLCLMDPLLPFGFMMRCLKAYAVPPKKNKDANKDATTSYKEQTSNATSPLDSNGFQRISPSQGSPSSFEEVSPSDLGTSLDQAHKSGSERRKSSDTTISAASLQSEHTHTGTTPPEDHSQRYVADFLERYVLDSDTDSEGRRIPIIKQNFNGPPQDHSLREEESEETSTLCGDKPLKKVFPEPDEVAEEATETNSIGEVKRSRITNVASGIMDAMTSKFSYIMASNNIGSQDMGLAKNMDALIARSPSDEFIFSVPKNPYLSPYFADDEVLKKFPPVRILSVHLDPCLDDCVMFAKKLKKLGNVVGIDVLEGLPHGFLNFSLMSREANEGSKLCVRRIEELMENKEHSIYKKPSDV